MNYGVTAQGFAAKYVEVIKAELEADWRADFGDSCDLDPQAPDGQIIGIFAERFAELWELAEGVYAAFDPDQNAGASQDAVAALTGTIREPARSSAVTATLTGDDGTVIDAGRVVSVETTNTRFTTDVSAMLALATEYTTLSAGEAVVLGSRYRVNDGGTDRIYQCSLAGNVDSPNMNPPSGTGIGQVDGTAHWDYLGDGKAVIDVVCSSQETGPKVAISRTLNVIETPVSGWKNSINVLDAILGADLETAANLRIRREQEVRATGNAAADAIRGDVLKVGQGTLNPVITCTVFSNDTDAVDGDGLPPHSIEVLVQGGIDADVAAAIWATKGAGIATYGTSSQVVTDAAGATHTVYFTRPTAKNIYVKVTLAYDARYYLGTGDDLVKAAIVAFGVLSASGKNVVASSIGAQAFKVDGVLDTSEVLIGLSNPPVASTTIPISLRELAVFDTSRVTVVSVPATP
jgi:uncharacterized phage protein gp47/JayE